MCFVKNTERIKFFLPYHSIRLLSLSQNPVSAHCYTLAFNVIRRISFTLLKYKTIFSVQYHHHHHLHPHPQRIIFGLWCSAIRSPSPICGTNNNSNNTEKDNKMLPLTPEYSKQKRRELFQFKFYHVYVFIRYNIWKKSSKRNHLFPVFVIPTAGVSSSLYTLPVLPSISV